jgi:opacity protein-like surface antigen
MRKFALIPFMFILLGGLAAAQIPTSGNVFIGYSFQNVSSSTLNLNLDRANLQGWEASLEGKLFPVLGIVADFSGHYGSESFPEAVPGGIENASVSAHELEVMFGPRVSISVGKFRPFAEVEVGVGHVNTNGLGSDTSFASAAGGGIDYRIIKPVAVRLQGDWVGTRFFGTTQNDFRLSTGVVLRF